MPGFGTDFMNVSPGGVLAPSGDLLQNLFSNTEDFSAVATWSEQGGAMSLVSSTNTDPAGGSTAQYWSGVSSAIGWAHAASGITFAADNVVSCYFHPNADVLHVRLKMNNAGNVPAYFVEYNVNGPAESATRTSFAGISGDGAEQVGFGLWRVWMYIDASTHVGTTPQVIQIYSERNIDTATFGTWGAQLEQVPGRVEPGTYTSGPTS